MVGEKKFHLKQVFGRDFENFNSDLGYKMRSEIGCVSSGLRLSLQIPGAKQFHLRTLERDLHIFSAEISTSKDTEGSWMPKVSQHLANLE